MKKGICDCKGELVDENLERFYKLWENAGKEVGAEKREGLTGYSVFLGRQKGWKQKSEPQLRRREDHLIL